MTELKGSRGPDGADDGNLDAKGSNEGVGLLAAQSLESAELPGEGVRGTRQTGEPEQIVEGELVGVVLEDPQQVALDDGSVPRPPGDGLGLHDEQTAQSADSRQDIQHTVRSPSSVDSLALPPAPEKEPRGSRIPLAKNHWWRSAAPRAMAQFAKERNIRAPGWRALRDAIGTVEIVRDGVVVTVEVSEDSVKRCVEGSHITWELAVPVSRVLGIASPAVISESEEHALALEDAMVLRQIAKLSGQLRSIRSREEAQGHTPPVPSTDGRRRRVRDDERDE